MPKKLYPQIVRQGAARLSSHDKHYISAPLRARGITSRALWGEKTVDHWRKQMGHGRREDRSLLYQPVRNGENHALSITCVLDLLLRLDHDAYVFPAGVTKLLNEEYGHLVQFDPYTVGRIFSGLLEAQGGIPADRQPLGTVHWGGARQIVVKWDDEGAWRWLGHARQAISRRAEVDQREARLGSEVPRSEEVWGTLEGLWNPDMV